MCKIIERINPDVIFEEIPPSYFDTFHINKSRRNLETDSINKYLENHSIKHIPVDSDDVPPESFFESYSRLLKRIEELINIYGFNFRNFNDFLRNHIYLDGFAFTPVPLIMAISRHKTEKAFRKYIKADALETVLMIQKIWKERPSWQLLGKVPLATG